MYNNRSSSTHISLKVSYCQKASCFMKCEAEFMPSLSNHLAKAEKLGEHFFSFCS